MTLTTHALVGAAAAQLFPSYPYVAFVAAFASHFAIDALPHWDYTILSSEKDLRNPLNNDMRLGKLFFIDLLRIGSDALLGIVLSVIIFAYGIFHAPLVIVLIGALGGIVPDPLQFVYFKTHTILLEALQRFHIWIQKGKTLRVHPAFGIFLQVTLVLAVVAIEKIVLH